MNISLVDLPQYRSKLFPFTLTRPIGDLRIGILTIKEKWAKHLNQSVTFLTVEELEHKFSPEKSPSDLIINGIICPDDNLVEAIRDLNDNEALYNGNELIAARGQFLSIVDAESTENLKNINYTDNYTAIRQRWDMFGANNDQIKADYQLLTQGRVSHPIADKYTIVYGEQNIFIEEGVDIKAAILNAEEGPIYLAKNSIIQEGATIRGPFSLGENSRINMNAKIREGVSIGPNCKIGGEVSNSIIYRNSNKAHDGYLGNAILGEWCNLGADTNNSNLKNNYDNVKVWDYDKEGFIDTGLQFCGLFMGDHSKTAINTMLNTGTTIGVCCNVFGSGFPRTFIPSFSWGGVPKSVVHTFEKAKKTAEIVMARKNIKWTDADEKILKTIFERSIKK
jgi:UDP-N-acetylglucosamine diphosphorylase/glucosamine-1-phosphate N-acetyltransferase